MPTCRRRMVPVVSLLVASAAAQAAQATGRVELELVTEQRVPITAQQEWLRRLASVGVASLRIRAKQPLDKVGVEVKGPQAAPVYVVTGVITSSNELLLPGGRFKATDTARIAGWLDELARLGPPDQRPPKAAFGLDLPTYHQVQKALAKPVGFSTRGMDRAELVQRIGRQLLVPLRVNADVLRTTEEDKLAEELSTLSCGTALAYALRAPGLCLVPREAAGGVELVVVQADPEVDAWPVGWPSEKPARDVLPAMYEFLNIELKGVAVSKVLDAVGGRLKVPILLDYNAMARYGVEPEKVFVDLPRSRTTYSLMLRKVLFQARLKSELRVDEAGRPFFWITTLKPI